MEGFEFPAEIIRTDRTWLVSICLDEKGMKVRVPQSLSDSRIINYVVAPELRRVLEHNHSRRYWRHVERVLPDYRDPRGWLKEYVHRLEM